MGFTRNNIDKKLTHNYLKTSNKQGELFQVVDISHSKIINVLDATVLSKEISVNPGTVYYH